MWNWDQFEQAGEALPAPIRALLDTVAARRIGFMPTLRVIDGLGDDVRSRVSRRSRAWPECSRGR